MPKHKFPSISLTVRDRAISSKFSTPRVSDQCTLGNFQKKFPLPKNGGHFAFSNFCQKMEKHKFAIISLTVQDRAISLKFSTHRVSDQCTLGNFQKKFPLPKNGGHFAFSNFCQKMEKHKFATISLTVQDRAISLKFSTHRVSEKCTLVNFQKMFFFPHMAAILNFRKQICFYLLNRAR